ncbi:Tat pathway signal protein [Methylorubrum aminovorans]|uniref:Tat pathway signal protein n=1 Tax=Methylorubrum aminovorans TaxID=269069 RepID=UPI000D597A7C|nr:Tat pathway signal protein [Methylobacterium sp. DM1]
MGRAMPGRSGIGGRLLAGITLAAFLTAPVPAALAQDGTPAAKSESKPDASPLKIELNRLEPAGEACRTYMLVDNSRGPALKSLKVDLFAFDTEGVAQKRLAVELGPVQEKKTVVRLFDFAGLACPKIGRLLLNDVLACEGGDATRETCLERIEPATKTSAAFDR